MDDSRIKKLAGVLGNDTCEKIIDYLEKNDEASASDISEALNFPLNTVDYNIKKLVESGIVEKKKKFFWSSKGKKIVTYGLSNKSIVISPKKSSIQSKAKSLVPGILAIGIGTILVKIFARPASFDYTNDANFKALEASAPEAIQTAEDAAVGGATDIVRETTVNNINIFTDTMPQTPFWVWFLLGALVALFVFSIVNWKKL